MYVKIKELGSFEDEGLFMDFVETREEKIRERILEFFNVYFNKGFEEEVIYPSLREDIEEIEKIGETKEHFVKEALEKCYLNVNGYDYSEELKEWLEEVLL